VKYEVIGKNHVAVPTHFFKVVVMEKTGQFEIMSFVMPNQPIGENIDLRSYLVPVESIERAAGLLFFEKIPKNSFRKINGR
jgi:endonuclease G